MASQTPSYLFESRPEAVAAGRKKFREPNKKFTVHDPRIVRGNTYAPGNLFVDRANASVTQAQEKAEQARQRQAAKKRAIADARARELAAEPQLPPGRVSIPLQTDAYLDELEDQSFSADASVQTDVGVTQRKAPKFKKKVMGVSIGTSILPGELFDFDMSIDPILEVLVGKCVDQGSAEVLREQELKLLNATEREYSSRTRAAELEAKRLMDETEKRYKQKEQVLAQHRARHQAQKTMALKVISQNISKSFLAGLQNTVLGQLEEAAVMPDPARNQVDTIFLPWLFTEVNKRLAQIKSSHFILDDVLTRTVQAAFDEVTAHHEAERRALVEMEEQRLNREAERVRLIALREEMELKKREAELKALESSRTAATEDTESRDDSNLPDDADSDS
jgi:hypothetical protein